MYYILFQFPKLSIKIIVGQKFLYIFFMHVLYVSPVLFLCYLSMYRYQQNHRITHDVCFRYNSHGVPIDSIKRMKDKYEKVDTASLVAQVERKLQKK